MRNVVIVAAARTPIGTIGGQFKTLTSLDLSIPVMQGLVERAGINPEIIEDVIWGCNYQRTYKENNLARVAAVKAGQFGQSRSDKSGAACDCTGHYHSQKLYFFHVIHPVWILPDHGWRSRMHHGRRC